MAVFLAMKFHYDHRKSLPNYLKYSRHVTHEEHEEFLRLFHEEGIGGEGFHECLNFAMEESGPVKIYIPPTCMPDEGRVGSDEVVIFSFTYQHDRELPSRVIGIHAGVVVHSRDGRFRPSDDAPSNGEPLYYHAEAPSDLSTLLVPPLPYSFREGRYTPVYASWGNGLRYLSEDHAENILADALSEAASALGFASGPRKLVIAREIEVLQRVRERYFPGVPTTGRKPPQTPPPIPDQELGRRGEEEVFLREIDAVKALGLSPGVVEWVSRAVPTAPYDLKTVRMTEKGLVDFYLEVKSTRMVDTANIYLSSGQIEFMESNTGRSALVHVIFGANQKPQTFREFTLAQLRDTFDFAPIKFKLRDKIV